MKFKVNLGWRSEYIFDDIDIAANFAITALKSKCYEDNDDYSVKIELIPDKSDQEGDKDNEE